MLFGIDWNNKLKYNSVKIVTMRDWRLGLLHYTFMFLVIVYIGVWTILIQQKYVAREIPLGTVRLSLLQGKNPTLPTALPYCLIGDKTSVNGYKNYPCLYYDAQDVVSPTTEQSAMFATTRLRIKNQTVSCSFLEANCGFKTVNDSTYYIGDIERFTLLVDHTLYTPSLGIQYNARQLIGEMTDVEGKTLEVNSPSVVGVAGKVDIIQLSDMLRAAGINSLDDPSGTSETDSMRYDGVVLMVFIDYNNLYSYNLNNIKYTYKVRVIPNTEFKGEDPLYLSSTQERIINDRHGIRMVILQGGDIGKFDFQVLLLSFVSGIGLLTIATTIVDFIAMNLVKEKSVYGSHKFEVTESYQAEFPLSRIKSRNYADLERRLLESEDEPKSTENADTTSDYVPPTPAAVIDPNANASNTNNNNTNTNTNNPNTNNTNPRDSAGWSHYYAVPK